MTSVRATARTMPTRAATRRAALYLRQSPTRNGEEGIDRQRARTTALATARGWHVVGEYVDLDVSASKPRTGSTAWGRMLADARAGRLDVVIAVDLDRLLRSTRDLNTLVDHGLAAVTVDGEIDLTTADGEFRATMLAAIARFEVRRKGERQTRANVQRAERGGVPKGTRCTGYNTDGTIRPDEAERVRALFDGFARGDTLRGLAARYDLTPSTVRTILTNPRYAGRRAYMRRVEAATTTTPARYAREVVGTGAWEPLVTPALFDLVNARLDDPRRRTNLSGSTARKHLGSGLYLCECGWEVVDDQPRLRADARPVVSGGNGDRYRCRACGMNRTIETVDAYVLAVLAERLRQPDALDALRPAAAGDDRLAGLLTEQAAITERLGSLAALVADGTLSPDDVRAAVAPLRARLADVEAALGASTTAPVLDGLDDVRDDLEAAWPDLPLDRRRALVGAFLTVTLHRAPRGSKVFDPDTVTLAWKGAAA